MKPDRSLLAADAMRDPLPGPFAEEPGEAMAPLPALATFAAGQVRALLDASPAFYQLPEATRRQMRTDLEKISTYTATLIHDDWHQSRKLDQMPMVRERRVIEGTMSPADDADAPARTQADGFATGEDGTPIPVAASNVARITEDTLNAIAFPTFVADLLQGTFKAIVDSSIQQMEAYAELLSNVAKTVTEFMQDNITNNNARDWLAGAYPQVI
ncbi:MAG: hypothetical protein ACR2RE_19260, partial [Geminicoccaceae bacterium]